jgi:hypothetical protein
MANGGKMRSLFFVTVIAVSGIAHAQEVDTLFAGPGGTRWVGKTGDVLRDRCEHTQTCWRYRYDRWTNSYYRVIQQKYYGTPEYRRAFYPHERREERRDGREERREERRDLRREERREERRDLRREVRREERRDLRRDARREREDDWERRDESLERGEFCKDEVVRVVGVEHVTEAGAKEAAIRQWQATVRYDYGERYLDIDNARRMRWRCDRSGTNESLAGRVGEAVTGGSGFLKRCIVMAVPCMTPLHKSDKEEPSGSR